MKTTRPIATISFNTEAYLRLKLDELIKAKKITFYAYIPHRKEEDENKDHIHLFLEPNNPLLTFLNLETSSRKKTLTGTKSH